MLSCLLWSVTINSLIKILKKEGFKVVAYADDLVIICTGQFDFAICERMNKAMGIVARLCNEFKLKINTKKPKICVLQINKQNYQLSDIKVYGQNIKRTMEFKYRESIWILSLI